jgi:undecaprenyl diphosphate synthase
LNSDSLSPEAAALDPERLPRHVAIIMDGNGRWAKKKLLNRIKGHEKGADAVREAVKACREIGISYLTLYAFSTENWQRPRMEVDALMTLLKKFLHTQAEELRANNIRLHTIGETDRLPDDVRQALEEVLSQTRHNDGLHLILALSYGGRSEIIHAVRGIASDVEAGRLSPTAIDEALLSDKLFTRDIPDPDLLIRTSGELRLSNFLLWQLAYAEFYFTPTLWPDFSKDEFYRILAEYQGRERRFGQVDPDQAT